MGVSSLDDLYEDYLEALCRYADSLGEAGDQDGCDEDYRATKLAIMDSKYAIWDASANP